MSDIDRISPQKVREKVLSGDALLVCAYDDDYKYHRMRLDGSMALSTFRSELSGLIKDREIIFY